MVRSVRVLPFLLVVGVMSLGAQSPQPDTNRVRERYTKYEYMVPMRDGVRLFTSIYVPKDASRRYPFLLTRTPYSVGPYGVDNYRPSLGPSEHFEREGFIFVNQDARGRYLSEGEFLQVRPHVATKRSPKDVDESTDTFDTIVWLLANIPRHNGRVGMVGVSQPGFHAAASVIDAHPALKAVSPQAPTADYYLGDDVYHNGAFMLGANFGFYSGFKPRVGGPGLPEQGTRFDMGTPDAYEFFLRLPPLRDVNARLFGGTAAYWQEIVDHPNYDTFWQVRSIWKHVGKTTPAVLNVGGWFDAEDPVGPLHMYRAIERSSPGADNRLVMGPWSHGGWGRGPGSKLGNLDVAVKTGEVFRQEMQFAFFMHYLKDAPWPKPLPKAMMFATGINEFRGHDTWPPAEVKPLPVHLGSGGRLSPGAVSQAGREFDEYVSDPNRPVPFVGYIAGGMTSDYMTEDQRFAAQRPDVLVYMSPVLDEDLTIAGPVPVKLTVSTSGTDSDFVVKLIDVYPGDHPQPDVPSPAPGQPVAPRAANAVRMGGYQQLVRGEPFRAKFRSGFEKPVPMVPGQPSDIQFDLPDVYHVFRRGHRVMVQIQSSWFPLVDRNPQRFMDIPSAKSEDFRVATQRVYRASTISLPVLAGAWPGTSGR